MKGYYIATHAQWFQWTNMLLVWAQYTIDRGHTRKKGGEVKLCTYAHEVKTTPDITRCSKSVCSGEKFL